ncbi:MAG: outer membrane protein [Hyphomicrobiales bacterium]
MKKLFFAALGLVALASSSATAAPYYSWSGCYVGANAGGAWMNNNYRDAITLVDVSSYSASGFIGGGQVGCDFEAMRQWVFGMQGLFDWGNFEGSGPLSSLPVNTEHTRVSWLWSMTGRVGFLVQPAALVYVKGGGAWVHEHHFETMSNDPNYLAEALVNRIGWTAGGGFEYMVTTNWSAFLEYDYMGFGGHFTNFNCPACTLNFEIRQNMQQALFGLNYRFGN